MTKKTIAEMYESLNPEQQARARLFISKLIEQKKAAQK